MTCHQIKLVMDENIVSKYKMRKTNILSHNSGMRQESQLERWGSVSEFRKYFREVEDT